MDFKDLEKKRLKDLIETGIVPQDNLILSAIGGRVCYSSSNPIDLLLKDEKVVDPRARETFLRRLAGKGHFSVFAHSPIFVKVNHGIVPPFKFWVDDDLNGCGNMRHILELEHMSWDPAWIYSYPNILEIGILNGYKVQWVHWQERVELLEEEKNKESGKDPEVIGFRIKFPPFDWYAFLITKISLVETHQHVRHTWQNFNQRSYRYTEAFSFVTPPSIQKMGKLHGDFRSHILGSFSLYRELILNGVKKEDARFILPVANMTTLMTSGPRFVFEDFVQKRIIKAAQWEIRKIAERISLFLES